MKIKIKNIILFSIIQSFPLFFTLFLLDIFKERIIFSFKNILTLIIFCLINIIAVIFHLLKKYSDNKNKIYNNSERDTKKNNKSYKTLFYIILCISLFSLSVLYFTKTLIIFPEKRGFVNDYANLLSQNEENKLDNFITGYTNEGYFPIIIVIINNTFYYRNPIQYFIDLGKYWINSRSTNSILIGYCVNCEYICILPSRGLAQKIKPELLDYTLNNLLMPEFFRNKNYFNGIEKAITDLYSLAENMGLKGKK